MSRFTISFGVVAVLAGAYYYFSSGSAPVAVADPMMPFERKMASMTLDAHIEEQHVGKPPIPADEPNLMAGVDIYQRNCGACRAGDPRVPKTRSSETGLPIDSAF